MNVEEPRGWLGRHRHARREHTRNGIRKAVAALQYAEALIDAGVHTYSDIDALLTDDARFDALERRLRAVPGNGTGDVRLGYLWSSSVTITS